jgi:hypothetical protein
MVAPATRSHEAQADLNLRSIPIRPLELMGSISNSESRVSASCSHLMWDLMQVTLPSTAQRRLPSARTISACAVERGKRGETSLRRACRPPRQSPKDEIAIRQPWLDQKTRGIVSGLGHQKDRVPARAPLPRATRQLRHRGRCGKAGNQWVARDSPHQQSRHAASAQRNEDPWRGFDGGRPCAGSTEIQSGFCVGPAATSGGSLGERRVTTRVRGIAHDDAGELLTGEIWQSAVARRPQSSFARMSRAPWWASLHLSSRDDGGRLFSRTMLATSQRGSSTRHTDGDNALEQHRGSMPEADVGRSVASGGDATLEREAVKVHTHANPRERDIVG